MVVREINKHKVYPIFTAEDEGSVFHEGKELKMVIITKWTDITEKAKEKGHKCFYFYPQNQMLNSLMENESWCEYVYKNFKNNKMFNLKKTMIELLLEAGYKKEDMFHHNSDLYIYVTPLTTKIVEEWCNLRQFRIEWHCPKFKDQVTGKQMYDCAFQYYEEDKNASV